MATNYNTVHLFDLDFISATHHTEVLEDIISYQHESNYRQKLPLVITPNADQIVKLNQPQYQVLKEKLSHASFIFPDGQPIVWFSKLIRKPLKARLTGSDLFPLLWQQAKERQHKILIVTSNELLGEKLTQDYQEALCYTPPFFNLDSPLFNQVCQDLVHHIENFKPNYVIVGIGFPKQEWLTFAIQSALVDRNISSPLFLCLGASAEFYAGMKKRAPRFLQKIGLEWLHRLWLEPKRMWKRYILGSFSLLVLLIKEFKKQIFHAN